MGRQKHTFKIYVVLICSTFSAVIMLIQNTRSAFFPPPSPSCICQSANQTVLSVPSPSRTISTDILDTMEFDEAGCRVSPSSLMDQTRRKIGQTIQDQWLFLLNQIHSIQKLTASNSSETDIISKSKNILQYIIAHGSEYNRVLQFELSKLAIEDGWNGWRMKEIEKIKRIIHDRIMSLQNPSNCSQFPVLVCNLTNPCGFASGVHDVLWCFIRAFKEQRRLVVLTSQWHYVQNGWETLFLPLSETCRDDDTRNGKVVSSFKQNNNKARWIMRTLPQDLGPRMIQLHGDPLAWWYGQFLQYLMRPNPQLSSHVKYLMETLNFSEPIAGIHVRRTDKIGSEAKAHDLEEYMEHVEAYYQGIEIVKSDTIKRRVYIATDEPGVLSECHQRFPMYECLYYNGSAEMALKQETRYSNNSLWSLVVDIFLISNTDYLVCTQSSGVCRLAYELKQALIKNVMDSSNTVLSLDIPHHYAWVTPAARKAIYNHKPKSSKEIPFKRGDVFTHKNEFCTVKAAVKGKAANGFIKMILNQKEKLEGFIPMYKTRKMFEFLNFSLTDALHQNEKQTKLN